MVVCCNAKRERNLGMKRKVVVLTMMIVDWFSCCEILSVVLWWSPAAYELRFTR